MKVYKSASIITWDGFQDQEVIYPYYRLIGASFVPTIYSGSEKVKGLFGIEFPSKEIKDLSLSSQSLLVLPGGVKALEKLRQQKEVIEFIKNFYTKKNNVILSTCHGAQLLISARLCNKKEISGYYSIRDDIENAGGIYSDDPVTVSDRIVSSPHYKYMGEWMETGIDLWKSLNIKK